MSCDCCKSGASANNREIPVEMATVKSMVDFPLWQIDPGDEYFFDQNPDSEVVYYSHRSGNKILEEHLREKVYCKHPGDDDVYVCYCFKVTVGDLRRADRQERLAVLERVKAATARGQCSCATRNPRGRCCLADIKALVDRLDRAE